MAKRQKEWARKKRDELFDLLGRKCNKCGSTEELEFDLRVPNGDNKHHKKMDWSHRMSFYRLQHALGNLQVLCTHCNSKKGDQMEFLTDKIDCPF